MAAAPATTPPPQPVPKYPSASARTPHPPLPLRSVVPAAPVQRLLHSPPTTPRTHRTAATRRARCSPRRSSRRAATSSGACCRAMRATPIGRRFEDGTTRGGGVGATMCWRPTTRAPWARDCASWAPRRRRVMRSTSCRPTTAEKPSSPLAPRRHAPLPAPRHAAGAALAPRARSRLRGTIRRSKPGALWNPHSGRRPLADRLLIGDGPLNRDVGGAPPSWGARRHPGAPAPLQAGGAAARRSPARRKRFAPHVRDTSTRQLYSTRTSVKSIRVAL
eukprot:2966022-Prymnesium_polylepis.1